MGVFGALGFAAWIGIPTMLFVTADQIRSGVISALEFVVIITLAAFALFTAWRFHKERAWIVGPILLVALFIELTKRTALTFQGTLSFGVVDVVITFMIFFGLLNGIRGARALRHLLPENDLHEVFE